MIVDVSSFLAEALQTDTSGKVNGLGIGWSVTGPPPLAGIILALHVRLSPDEVARPVKVTIKLVDGNGVGVNLPFGSRPFEATQITESTPNGEPRPPGVNPTVLAVLGLPPVDLPPGPYRFEFSVDGEVRDSWYRPFYVRATPDEFPS
jgi:hypothetical protein